MAPRKTRTTFAAEQRQMLPGSEKQPFHTAGEKPATGRVTVSVMVRAKTPLATRSLGRTRLSRREYGQTHGPDRADLRRLTAFAAEFGLTVEPGTPAPGSRIVQLTGPVAAMQKAFGVELRHAVVEGTTYRVREGGIHLPQSLVPAVVAVLGLDNRPQAKAHFRVGRRLESIRPATEATTDSYTPVQVGQLYSFPSGVDASGQTIGLIELGGGYRTADITAYFKSLNLTPPRVVAVPVDKGKNAPSNANGADGEVMLDIEVAAAVAPGATIAVYFAPNTDQGFIDAISAAVHDTTNKPGVISISWGGPESSWTQQSMTALDQACQAAAALGITITVAAGDDGSTDGQSDGKNHVDFPASSPHVLACGGTKLVGSGSEITSETVWNEQASKEGATGGGVSTFFALPTWQATAGVPQADGFAGRGVPDVAGDADPATGYIVRVDGQSMVIGGTSAVAPLWAGLIAAANAQNGSDAGFLQPLLYGAKGRACFHDITSGDNGGYSAGPGWDPCTGLGSPIGTAVARLLRSAGGPAKKKKKPGHPTKAVAKRAGSGKSARTRTA